MSQRLSQEIDRLHTTLESLDPTSEDYERVTERLQTLYKIKENNFFVKPEVIFNGAVSLTSLLLVLNFEKLDIITGKAFSLIRRP